MKIKGLHFCSFDPFEDNIRFRQHNNPQISFGAIVYDTITKDTSGAVQQLTGSTQSLTITIGSNSNRILIVGVHVAVTGSGAIPTVSTVQIGATNFTHLSGADGQRAYSSLHGVRTEIWYLINPPTGSQTVNVTLSASASFMGIGALSAYNVDQSTGLQSGSNNNGNNSALNVSITPTVKNSWCFAAGYEIVLGTKSFSDTSDYDNETFGYVFGQHKASPTINSANTLQFDTGSPGNNEWASSGCEILAHHS